MRFKRLKERVKMRVSSVNQNYGFLKSNFKGYPVMIVDGGKHASDMSRFAHAVNKNMDVEMVQVEVNPKDERYKQMKSLENELAKLNQNSAVDGKYIAIPAFAFVPVRDFKKAYYMAFNEDLRFYPQDLSWHTEEISRLLKAFYDNPEKYKQELALLDVNGQGLEYTHGVVEQINKLVEKGAQVYIPSGQPKGRYITRLAKEKGYERELRVCLTTGLDTDDRVAGMYREIDSKDLYDFNLLSVSNAKTIGVSAYNMAQKYLFETYDALTSGKTKGIYNISPVRENDEVIGYSYTDTSTVQYPLGELMTHEKIERLNKFVGKKLDETTCANEKEIERMKQYIKEGKDTTKCPDKLYSTKEVLNERFATASLDGIRKGRYVDNTLKERFDVNDRGDIIYPYWNWEANRKPAVFAVAGTDYAVIRKISDDIDVIEEGKAQEERENSGKDIDAIIKNIKEEMSLENWERVENWALKVINNNKDFDVFVWESYLASLMNLNKNEEANDVADKIIEIYSKKISQMPINSFSEAKEAMRKIKELNHATPDINSFSDAYKILMQQENGEKKAKEAKKFIKATKKLAELNTQKSQIQRNLGNDKKADLYNDIAEEISKQSKKGEVIIETYLLDF